MTFDGGDPRVYDLVHEFDGMFSEISSSAVGLSFNKCNDTVFLQKKWLVWCTAESLQKTFNSVEVYVDEHKKRFVTCRGSLAQESGSYPRRMAEMIWDARNGRTRSAP